MGKRIILSDIELAYLRELIADDSKPVTYTSFKCIAAPAIEILLKKLQNKTNDGGSNGASE